MSLLCSVCKELVVMTLWCQKEEKLTEHSIVATQRQTPRDGVIPLEVSAVCGCGRGGTFICNLDSVTV